MCTRPFTCWLLVCTLLQQQQQHERSSIGSSSGTTMTLCGLYVCMCVSAMLLQLLGGAPASQLIQFMSAFTDGDLLWRCAGA